MPRHPDLEQALRALCVDRNNPDDMRDFELIEDIWARRALAPLFGQVKPSQQPIDPADPPTLRLIRGERDGPV